MEDIAARTLGRVAANGIDLAYETFGDASGPPVVLIMGLATQMIAWPDEMCEGLARRGHFVVRFDNRDVGGSTHLANVPPPRLADVLVRRRRRIRSATWLTMRPGSSMAWAWATFTWSGRRWADSSRRPSRWRTPPGFAR